MPLPIPQHPLSHIALDFITDLPESAGKTTILVVLDRFSRSLCLITLPGLPSVFDLAKTQFTYVFRYFGLPENIVSD